MVSRVESVACQKVKKSGLVITSMEEIPDPSEVKASHAIDKFAANG